MNNKDKYGEVFTPPGFIEHMIQDTYTIMENDFFLSMKTIFEPGAGKGIFFDILQNKHNVFKDKSFHYYMNEINRDYENLLLNISLNYRKNVSILMGDLFDLSLNQIHQSIDFVIGNLPFNVFSKKFVPGLSLHHKEDKNVTNSKSITIWNKMTHFLFEHIIKQDGFFFCIIPCIWMKPDKAHVYELFTQYYTIHFLKYFDCVEANRVFQYHCQTPICYVLVQKKINIHKDFSRFKLYDERQMKYMDFQLFQNYCIPTKYSDLFSKSIQSIKKQKITSLSFLLKKISTLNPNVLNGIVHDYKKGKLEHAILSQNQYKIITGSSYDKKTNYLTLNGFVSTLPCLYYNQPKVILPHKRLPKFFKDYDGSYSCFGRDMYVFLCNSKEEIDLLYDYLNQPLVLKMIQSGFTIRMNFIEKYVFEYIPNPLDSSFTSFILE